MESIQSKSSPIDRKFLHDLSSPLTVLKIVADRIRTDMGLKERKYTDEQYLAWMQKVCGAIESLERILAEKKSEMNEATKG